MPQSASQLIEGALVSLDLGHEAQPMLCRIVAFGGDGVVLTPTVAPDAEQCAAVGRRGDAFLLVEGGETLRALRCRVHKQTDEGEVVAQIIDSFRLGQRRMFSRASLVLPALVTPLTADGHPAGESWRTFTRDVSAGGARLARQSAYCAASLHALVLNLPGDQDAVETVVEVQRESEGDLGVRFFAISPDDRVRLEQAAITWQRARLRPRPPRRSASPGRLRAMRPYEGLLTAMVTPFRRDSGAVDEDAAVALGRHLLAHGSHGLVVCGTTGEATTLTDDEQRALVELMVVGGRRRGDDRRRRRLQRHAPRVRAHRAGRAGRRARHPLRHALLQQAQPARHRAPLRGGRGCRRRHAGDPLQHPRRTA